MRQEAEKITRKLRLPYMRNNWEEMIRRAEQEKPGYEEFLYGYLQEEYRQRLEKGIQKKIQMARFPNRISLAEFKRDHLDLEIQQQIRGLATLDFIDKGENVILIGNPGTGKTALSIALGLEACLEGKSCLFISIPDLLIEIREAMSLNEISRYRQRFENYDLVILDELGYCSFDKDAGEVLFNLISRRNEKKSIILSSNLMLDRWQDVLRDPVLTAALVDRLTCRAYLLNMTGASFRTQTTKRWMEDKSRSKGKKKKQSPHPDCF